MSTHIVRKGQVGQAGHPGQFAKGSFTAADDEVTFLEDLDSFQAAEPQSAPEREPSGINPDHFREGALEKWGLADDDAPGLAEAWEHRYGDLRFAHESNPEPGCDDLEEVYMEVADADFHRRHLTAEEPHSASLISRGEGDDLSVTVTYEFEDEDGEEQTGTATYTGEVAQRLKAFDDWQKARNDRFARHHEMKDYQAGRRPPWHVNADEDVLDNAQREMDEWEHKRLAPELAAKYEARLEEFQGVEEARFTGDYSQLPEKVTVREDGEERTYTRAEVETIFREGAAAERGGGLEAKADAGHALSASDRRAMQAGQSHPAVKRRDEFYGAVSHVQTNIDLALDDHKRAERMVANARRQWFNAGWTGKGDAPQQTA